MSWAYQLTDGWVCAHLDAPARGQAVAGPSRDREGAAERPLADARGSDAPARGPSDPPPKRKWKPFQPEGTPPRYSRDRVVDVEHLKLDLRLDTQARSVSGVANLTVRPIADAVACLDLDAVQLRVSRVTCRGRKVAFTNTGEKLVLAFAPPLAPGRSVTLAVRYSATPQRGLYFVAPDRRYPKKHAAVWSQGEDEENRHWFPCYDYPNEKATSEVLATVPGAWFCLSNGRLLEQRRNADGTATFHWLQEIPHASYLITLCAGRYVKVADEWDGIPVDYYVPPGREADGARSFGPTPRMLEYYSKLIGVRYPFAKYAQITAADFIFGGMENTSATTQTERTLHDARAHLDYSSEPLVAHELVHSWFGNLVTCRDWSHAWLNESFATFFDNLWYRHDRGEDEFRYEMYADLRQYLEEDSDKYRRPIATNIYRQPSELFDRHLYQKGACFLNLLRHLLGDRLFFKAVNLYVERFRERTAITPDLVNIFEETTGRNLEWLFDQWIFKGGHPDFEVSAAWDAGGSAVALTIRQKQPPDELTPVFRLPLKVRLVGRGYDETPAFDLTESQHVFHVGLPARPRWIAFDPENTIPKTLELRFDEDQLAAQLLEDDDVMGRVYAAQALGKRGTGAAEAALGRGLLRDRFWGVQAECAAALARVHTPGARAILVTARLKHPKARRAVAKALGEWHDGEAARALTPLARRDASYFVEAAATESLGLTRIPTAWPALVRALRKGSHLEVIRAAALRGLVELDPRRALPILEDWSRLGRPTAAREAALGLLGRAARESDRDSDRLRVRPVLERVLDEGFYFDRLAAIRGLRDLRDRAALPALARLLGNRAVDARVVRAAEDAAAALREAGGVPPEVRALREDVDRLKSEAAKLRDQLGKLEASRPAAAARKRGRTT